MTKLEMITANKLCDNKKCPDYGQTDKEDTVSSWLKKAATHIEKIEELLLGEYHVDKAQMDSLWTYVGNKGKKGGTKRNQIKVLSGVADRAVQLPSCWTCNRQKRSSRETNASAEKTWKSR